MLPARHRLRDSAGFRHAVRAGHRSGGRLLVVHLLDEDRSGDSRAGLIVAKSVGTAVIRNTVKRRLRHLVAQQLGCRPWSDGRTDGSIDRPGPLPAGSLLVVRALPDAAGSSSAELGAELDRCLGRLLREPA